MEVIKNGTSCIQGECFGGGTGGLYWIVMDGETYFSF
jgi:hypothetical protein